MTLPTPPSPNNPGTFDDDADAFLAALPQFEVDMNALRASVSAIAAGAAFAIPYTFSAATADADPGAGKLRLDNATQNAATTIRADLSGADGATWTGVLDTFDDSTSSVKGQLLLVKLGDATKWAAFNVTALASPTGYRNIAVTPVAASSASPFADNDAILLKFTRAGDKGDTGPSGSGGGGGVYTGNTTLTAASVGAGVVTPTAPGQYMVLDDARNFSKGIVASRYNASDYDYGIKDQAGNVLGWIRPKTTAIFGCADNATLVGSWAISNLEKIGITAQYNNPTLANIGTNYVRLAIDANRELHIFGGAASSIVYGQVYDKSQAVGSQWGSPTALRSSGSGSMLFNAVLSASNQVLLVSCSSGGTDMEAVTITLSGVGLTPNTANKSTATLASAISSGGTTMMGLIAVGTGLAVAYNRAGTTACCRGISLSGVAPSIGAEITIQSNTSVAPNIYAQNGYLVAVAGSVTNANIAYVSASLSGATLTAVTTITSDALAGFSAIKSVQLSSGRVVAVFNNNNLTATILTVNSGTGVLTKSTVVVSTTATSFSPVAQVELVIISATKVGLFYHQASGAAYFNTVIDTSGTASIGGQLTVQVNAALSNSQMAALGVAGNIASFVGGNSTESYVFNIDMSGAPALSSVASANFGSTNAGVPQVSDTYGNRNARTLVAGGALYGHPTTSAQATVASRFSSAGLQCVKAAIPQQPSLNHGSAYGAAANESWFEGYNNGTGVYLTKIEVAA